MSRLSAQLRGTALAVLSALLTATGHVAGGGAVPDLTLLVVLLPLLAGAVVTVAERRTGLAATLATLAAGQVALHGLMVLMAPHEPPGAPGPVSGPAMVALHAVTTLAIAVMVRRADAAVAAVGAALRRVVARLLVPLAADRTPRLRVVPAPAVPGPLLHVLGGPLGRRGPPAGC